MPVFKCKMCGGALEIQNNETVAVCEYCGTQQTLPRLDDDRRANLYDRANHFRRANEFDKAAGIYEQILNEDSADAEAYWSLVLCRYGIEYVEDPATHRRVPTVNRAQFTSIFDDADYQAALQHADAGQRAVYEEEARAINEIQKGILAISQKEEPFDVFICYKETDSNGRRTPDSVLANDLYHQLTQEGFKVFFSRITLEDKLGTAYEPYIFAALNSAKVMVALGTKPEYFNAVWVKNEWSRYLALIRQGQKKMLIPAYKDMDPYDLPEEFSHLQAQDMSKLGFMQDLIRGVKKIVTAEEPKAYEAKETVVSGGGVGAASLLKRAFMFLEDGDWSSADEYCEKVLDADPECAEAYLGKLMAELKVKKPEALKDCAEPFNSNSNYQKAERFADAKLKNALKNNIEYINTRNENARLESVYIKACTKMASVHNETSYKEAAELFRKIPDYRDSAALAKSCVEKAEAARKDAVLSEAKARMANDAITGCERAEALFESIPGWRDADEQLYACRRKKEELQTAQKRKRKIAVLAASVVCIAVVMAVVINNTVILPGRYNAAIALREKGDLEQAYSMFIELGKYKDAAEQAQNMVGKDPLLPFKICQVGDYIEFGTYEQDNDASNGKEAIEWLVLETQDDKILILSKYGLDCKAYSVDWEDITWETCTLRKWLNEEFINEAFTESEKLLIPTVTVSADRNPGYDTNPGNPTKDKVFLLSIDEANRYFSSDRMRQCRPTEYADANNIVLKKNSGNCEWLLRSPGIDQDHAACVGGDGRVDAYGSHVDYDSLHAVRPALWIDLSS